jgi:hypothetical protein
MCPVRPPQHITIDLRLTRNFRLRERGNLELAAEVFNIASRLNVTNLNRTFGPNATPNATFNLATAAETSRQFQLAIRYSF